MTQRWHRSPGHTASGEERKGPTAKHQLLTPDDVQKRRRNNVIQEMLTGRVLDYGCGRGAMVASLVVDGYDAWGVDVDPAVIEKSVGTSAQGRLALLDQGRIPFPDQHFDIIVSEHVFEHVQDHDAMLDELRRVLKPAGKIYATFPPKFSFLEPHLKMPLVHWMDRGRGGALVRTLSRLGIHPDWPGASPSTYAEYLTGKTNYRSNRAWIEAFHRHGFSAEVATPRVDKMATLARKVPLPKPVLDHLVRTHYIVHIVAVRA